MKKSFILLLVLLCTAAVITAEINQIKKAKFAHLLKNKIYVYYLCMHKQINNSTENSAMVVLKELSASGTVISNAKVSVNGYNLAYNAGIQTYMGTIGSLKRGQKVAIKIRTKDGREVSGYMVASYFVRITKPAAFTSFPYGSDIMAKWRFSDHGTYQIVFKLLRGETQIFSTDILGNSTTVNFKTLGLKIPRGEKINFRVISPWTNVYQLLGPVSQDSKADFFTSATVTIENI